MSPQTPLTSGSQPLESPHAAQSEQVIATPNPAHAASTPSGRDVERRLIALHKQDYTWARATVRHLRARGVANSEVERIISDLVEVFVRRGRHGREVYGTPRTQAAFHPAGTTAHLGSSLRRFLGVPLLVAAVVAAIAGLLGGPELPLYGAAVLLAAAGAVTIMVANRRDSRLPEHISLMSGAGTR